MNFIDLHQDLAGAGALPKLSAQTDFLQLEKANTKILCATGFALPEENLEEVVLRDLDFYLEQCKKNPHWKMIRTGEDVREVMADSNAHGVLFHIEGVPGFTGDWKLLESWYEKGLRSIGLVWNDDNALGGGTNSNNGLTELGVQFIAWCEERGILIDLAHANPTMFADCLAVAKRPPYVSHGGLSALVPHRRNFTDDQLREVVGRGGIFGVFFAKSSMTTAESFTAKDIAMHIKRAVDVLGDDAVAIGTDFGGIISGTPEKLSSVVEIGNLWDELNERGLSREQIEGVAYKNAERYLIENISHAI